MPNPVRSRFEVFATTAPGLESIAAGELKSLGLRGRPETGGVSFGGDLDSIYRANLELRTASRVLVRLGHFHASTFYELERRAKKLSWADFLPATGPVVVRATCRKSRLYHSDAVAERVLSAIARVAPSGLDLASAADDTPEESEESEVDERSRQIFVVRIVDDQVEISADSSGALLHRRGYRREVGRAPLRETLAAAMLLASGWRKTEPLLDPMCGSGTIPIEAALLARGIAPGINRDFQFMRWPGFNARVWNELVSRAREAMMNPALVISGSDRDAGAIGAAGRNAERAGVTGSVELSVDSITGSLSRLPHAPAGAGWILSNPPYGVRVGDGSDLRDLYATLSSAAARNPAWRLGVLSADPTLAGQLRLPMRSRFDSRNGGIPVSFLVTEKSATRSQETTFVGTKNG